MSVKSKIEWTDATWNPVTGCTKVSEGCRNCYALTFAERWRGVPGHYFENGFDIQLRPHKLEEPLKWKRPRKIFVNSMSDLFHESIDEKYIAKVFGIMALAQQHTFQVLTKRPERMMKLLNSEDFQEHTGWFASQACREYGIDRPDNLPGWPNPNIWLGTSVENQKAADERIPLLLQTPAAVRFLSCEPLIGQLDLTAPGMGLHCESCATRVSHWCGDPVIHWVIAGGESGPGARPMNPDWARSIRDQCQAAGVAFHFKQFGEWIHNTHHDFTNYDGMSVKDVMSELPNGLTHVDCYRKVGKKKAGRLLDGRTWDEIPEDK